MDFGGAFINPNEPGFSAFAEITRQRTGALISVGTFRALMLGSYGHFQEIVLFDFDATIVEFNRRQIEALKISESLAEFFANLVERPADVALFQRAIEGEAKARHEILQPPLKSSTELGYRADDYVSSVFNLFDHDDGSGFLKNGRAYLRLRRLAIEGRMHAVQGDLAGRETLKAIGKLLERNRIQVGMLDVSNSPYYILNPRNGNLAPAYAANLASLPWAKNAVVNFTTEVHGYPGHGIDRWSYYSVPAREYAAKAATFENRNGLTEGSFIRSLRGTDSDLNPGSCKFLFKTSARGPASEAKPAHKIDPAKLAKEIASRVDRVAEFKWIHEQAAQDGIRVWLFGGTAAAFAHYVSWDLKREAGDESFQKSRFDYDYTNIFRSTQDLDIVVDGTPEQVSAFR
ncbi:MAG: hypothetical protein AAB250_02410, partial [Bdellovibrionota bacterium]